jgi:DNA-binding MarR family transcriptional regulator
MQVSNKNLSSLVQKQTRTSALFIHVIAQQMNLQFTDIHCLNFLINNGPATAGQIATITNLTTGAVTAMIDRLERANFIQREPDECDRRKIIITLKSDNFIKSNIANNFFDKKVKKLLSTYSKSEQKVIAKWNEDITQLLQNETNKLTSSN